MLQLGDIVLKNDEYYIKKMFSGIDELIFDISIWDEYYPLIAEEASILETERGQTYLVKAVDGGKEEAKVRCLIDLDDFYGTISVPYTNGSATLSGTIVMPTGWTFTNSSGSTIERTIELPSATPMDVLDQCRDTYGVVFRFDNNLKTVTAYDPDSGTYVGAFMTRDLNLKEINYKGVSTDLITALYCVGKDGMTFADINDGKPYVTNGAYKSKLIWGYWQDDRYTVKENLLADATAKLAQLSVPSRSYQCDVVDLAKTSPEMYSFADFDLLKVVDLIDDAHGVTIRNKVVEYRDYPYYPDRNVITISTTTPKIFLDVKQLNVSLTNPNSTFQQVMSAAQESATQQILGGTGGYVVMHTNADNRIYEILIMDTNDVATATKVWRWNSGGLGYSSTGYSGTYTTAITQDGAIVADFITTGTLNAELINVINLIANHVQSTSGAYTMELWAAIFSLHDGDYLRSRLYTTESSPSAGVLQLFYGNATNSGLQDTAARVTTLNASVINVGEDSAGVMHGQVNSDVVRAPIIYNGVYVSGDSAYNGEIHTGKAYVKSVAPAGEGLYDVSWKLVTLSGGGTAYALCRK